MPRSLFRAASPTSHLTGRHVRNLVLGFFGLILLANGIFIWVSLSTFSGTTEEHAYVEGLRYNDHLAAAAEQRARGWQGGVTLDSERLTLILKDSAGLPVRGLLLEARIGRPATRRFDVTLPLLELAPGHYAAELSTAPGQWIVIIEGEDRLGRPFRTEARLWL